MPPNGTDDIEATGDLLCVLVELGRELDRHVAQSPFGGRRRMPPAERPASLAKIADLEAALDERVHLRDGDALRRCLRVRRSEATPAAAMRVLATVAFRQLVAGRPLLGVSGAARAAGLDQTAETLEARAAIRRMVAWGTLAYADGGIGDGSVGLGRQAIRALSGDGLDILWTEASLREDLAKGSIDDQVRALNRRAAMEAERVRAMASLAQGGAPPPSGALPPNATAKQIFDALRQTVIGIDQPLRRFALQMSLHLRRVQVAKGGQRPTVPGVASLILGPSGAGKTYTCERFCAMAGLPFVIADMTQVTSSGYVGLDLSDTFSGLLAGGRKPEEAAHGLVIMDEIDKRKTSDRRGDVDVTGAGVQAEMLKLLEGTRLQIGGRRSMDSRQYLDTSGLAFILAGAFEALTDDIAKGGRRGSLGFGQGCDAESRPDIRDALKTYLLPELVNRLTSIIVFKAPTAGQVSQMIQAPKGIMSAVNGFLGTFGLSMSLDERAVMLVAGWAVESKTLARGARSLLSQLAEESVFEGRTGQIAVGEAEVKRAIDGMRAGAALGL